MASERYDEAIRRIDAANGSDPNTEVFEGREQPKELAYSKRMSAWVDCLDPDASEALRLAARAQHLCRWKVPRSEYPMTRAGYIKWRTTLGKMHAEMAADILRDTGYDNETIERVKALVQKKGLKTNPETQTLEDAAAVVFLENHFAEFAKRDDVDEAKLIDILRKTWRKMSERGHQAALGLKMGHDTRKLVEKAIAGGDANG